MVLARIISYDGKNGYLGEDKGNVVELEGKKYFFLDEDLSFRGMECIPTLERAFRIVQDNGRRDTVRANEVTNNLELLEEIAGTYVRELFKDKEGFEERPGS